MDINSFDQWLDTLSEALQQAKAIGMSDKEIASSATKLGGFLSTKIDPDIPENKLLKGLWDNGTEKEKEALSNMVVKLVEERKLH